MADHPESPPRLVLHPGHPKCGTSTVQYAIYRNVDLLERQGVFVPNRRFEFATDGPAFRERLGNPVHYFESVTGAAGLAEFESRLARLVEEIRAAGGRTVLISAENLGNQPGITERRPVHESLARHFPQARVLFYIRRQDEWMVSSWQQWGHKLGWDLERHVEKGIEDHRPDFLRAARFFEDVYGAGNVVVVPLDRTALIDGDLLADFSRRAEVGPLTLDEVDRFRNASLGSALCDVLARVHGVYEGTGDRRIRRLLESLPASRDLAFSRDKRILSPRLRRRVLRFFEADNRELHERYFPDVPFDSVFGAPPEDDDDRVAELEAQVEGLKDVLAIQADLILSLIDREGGPEERGRRRSWLSRLVSG